MKNLAKDPKARSLDALEFRSELVVLLDNIAQTKELRSLTCKSGKLNQTSTYLLIGLVVSVGAFVYLFLQKPKIAQTELGDTRLQKKIKLSRINLGNLKDRTEQAWLQQRNQSNLNFLLQLLPELAEDRRFHPRDNDSWERLSKTLTIIIQSSAGQMNYPLSLQMSTEAVRLAEENQKPHDLALFLRFQASNLLNLRQTNKAEEAITKAMNIVFKHKDFSPLDNSNIQFTGALVAQQNRKFHLAASRAMAASKVIEHIDSQDKIVYEHRTKYDLFAARQFFRMGTNGMHDKIVKALITRLRSETERNLVNHWIKVSRHYLEIGERSNARESLVEAIRVLSKYPLKPATRMEAVKSLKEILTLNFRDDVEYDSMLESLQEQEIR